MNIYRQIKKVNVQNLEKTALSISMEDGSSRSLTYESMFHQIEKVSDQLVKAGLMPGDRIAMVAENSPEWVTAYLAIVNITGTAVLIDAMLSAEEISLLLTKSYISCILTSPKLINKINIEEWQDTPIYNVFDIDQPFEGCKRILCSEKPERVKGDASVANIIYSSGTTRLASGIMHTHEAMLKSTQMCLDQINMRDNERFLGILPCSHIYGMVTTLIGPLLIGAEIRFIETLTADAILGAFTQYRPTIFPAVPKMLELFQTQIMHKINHDKKTKMLFQMFFPICYSLRKTFGINLGKKLFKSVHDGFGGAIDIICSAGAPLGKEAADFYYGCGFQLLITYGATETNIPTIGNLRQNLTTDTCGTAYPDVMVKISDTGEILIKSPYMMKGYFMDEQATKEAFADGWFMTGDLGCIDEKGRYHITGRVKDNIVLATGKKVIPDNVELQYAGIAGVKEFIVCGVPSSDQGSDEIHAFIVLEPGGAAETVVAAVYDRGATLSANMKIMQVHIVDEIPKTSLQKPKRYLLRKYAMDAVNQPVNVSKEDNDTVEERLITLISKLAKIDKSMISSSSKPFLQLGIDSLSGIELLIQIEDVFQVRMDELLTKEMTISDIAVFIEELQAGAKESSKEKSRFFERYPMEKRLGDYKLFRHCCGWARFLYKIKVKGEHRIPVDSGYIICANHITNLDYLWLCINFEKERFLKFCCMAKQELVNDSFLSKHLSRVCGMIPVDRGNINGRMMQRCKTLLHNNWGLLIHPEGTRSVDGKLGKLKHGAALLAIESNVPIIPAYIEGAFEIYPRGRKLPKLFDFSRIRKYQVKVHYGEPIYPGNLSVEQLTKCIEESMRALCTA